MKNKAKIMRQAERALKRTEFYLENRASNVDPKNNYELDYVLARKGGPLPDNAIAYAHFEEHIISFSPFERSGWEAYCLDWSFSLDSDLFFYMEQGYELAGMSMVVHSAVWEEIAENHESDCLQYLVGIQRYLCYCKKAGITAELLRKECWYGGPDVMALYGKPAASAKGTAQ